MFIPKQLAKRCLGYFNRLALMMLILPLVANATPNPGPEQVVRDFYDALKKQQCQKAVQLRPDYTPEKCQQTVDVEIVKIKEVAADEKKAYIELEVKYRKVKAPHPQTFAGIVKLERNGDQWIITTYLSSQGTPLPEDRANLPDHKPEKLNPAAVQPGSVPEPVHPGPVYPMPVHPELPAEGALTQAPSTFRSERILQSCWTKEELNGSPQDKIIIKPLSNPYRDPPARQLPLHEPPPLTAARYNSIRYVEPDPDKKLVALTFDLCEQTLEKTGYDPEIVNYLRENKVKATFFAGGKWMHSHPEKTMQLMADPLFEIGNHAWTHGNLRVLKGQEMEQQIIWTQAQYELLWENLKNQHCVLEVSSQEMNLIPRVPTTFRFPYGTCSTESLEAVNRLGLAAVQWNIVTGDPARGQTAHGIANIILDQIKPGSIIIAHANGRGWKTADALPLFIPRLRQLGYQFVTVSELLNSGRPVTATTCYELKPNDNLRYDRLRAR